jgi:hypothetical protein
MKRLLKLLVGAIAVFVGLVVLLAVVDPQPNNSSAAPVALDPGALCRAAIQMRVQFKDPASVRIDSTRVNQRPAGDAYVSVSLGARNSFGGYSLMECGCDLLTNGEVHVKCSQQ